MSQLSKFGSSILSMKLNSASTSFGIDIEENKTDGNLFKHLCKYGMKGESSSKKSVLFELEILEPFLNWGDDDESSEDDAKCGICLMPVTIGDTAYLNIVIGTFICDPNCKNGCQFRYKQIWDFAKQVQLSRILRESHIYKKSCKRHKDMKWCAKGGKKKKNSSNL